MRQKLAQFMYGRNGTDAFSRFLSYSAIIFLIIGIILRRIPILSSCLSYLGIAAIVYSDFRIFSKNLHARQVENDFFLRKKYRFDSYMNGKKAMYSQRKEYVFFKCPSCRCMLRLPRNKGKIRITCRKCGYSFEKKT